MENIDAKISDAQMTIQVSGFKTELWTPSFGWDYDESEAAATPFPLQVLAAFNVFGWMFCAAVKRPWVHLAAEMQAGKTGVLGCMIRLVLANYAMLSMKPADLFVLTGMKDNAWRLQTRKRLPKAVLEGVQHNDGLAKVAAALRLKNEKEPLRNVLIILDESHLASSYTNRPAKLIFDELLRMCPVEQWAERNIRVLTISATDPAKILSIGTTEGAQLVRLHTSNLYQSVESLKQAGRIHETEDLITPEAVARFKSFIDVKYKGVPLFHIIRPRQRKAAETMRLLEAAFPGCIIVPWDAEMKSSSDTSTVSSMVDINERLSEAPPVITFIVLKNMLYASKTLDDTHVGVLHDRVGAKDDTNLQSLLGRACGYGKSTRTHIFTSGQTVTNYIKTWRDLSDAVSEQKPKDLKDKMPSINVQSVAGGAKLSVSPSAPTPFTSSGAAAVTLASEPKKEKEKLNEDHYESEWSPLFPSLDAMKAWVASKGCKARSPNCMEGVYHCSTSGKSGKQPLAAIMKMLGGKKTANMAAKNLKLNAQSCRIYVGYERMEDNSSVKFICHRIKRIAE
jgi:hypothetical protein